MPTRLQSGPAHPDQWLLGSTSGALAIQIARVFGAEVTGVCSSRNVGPGAINRCQPRSRLHATSRGDRCATTCCLTWLAIVRWLTAVACSRPGGTGIWRNITRRQSLWTDGPHAESHGCVEVHRDLRLVVLAVTPNRANLATLGELLEGGKVAPTMNGPIRSTGPPKQSGIWRWRHRRGRRS